MKQLCVFLSAFLLFTLVGCNNIEISNSTKADITDFTAWLDNEGFVPMMSQSEMIAKMDSYTYNGQSVHYATAGCYYDSEYGGGYFANGENFDFANDYKRSEDKKTADYTNSFYTKVPLDGLTLPLGIEFEDTLRDVMAKLGMTVDLPSDFTPDEGTDVTMTLYKDKRYTLVFKNLYFSKEQIKVDVPYELVFTENYTFTQESGRESNVTRTIKLTFASDEDMLHEFSVEVRENYKLK